MSQYENQKISVCFTKDSLIIKFFQVTGQPTIWLGGLTVFIDFFKVF